MKARDINASIRYTMWSVFRRNARLDDTPAQNTTAALRSIDGRQIDLMYGYLELAGSADLLGTRRAVKVAGTLDGHPFEATLMPSGAGPHWLPLRSALCKAIGKSDAGEQVAVHLQQRVS